MTIYFINIPSAGSTQDRAHHGAAAGFEDARYFDGHGVIARDVFDHLVGVQEVDAGIGERDCAGVSNDAGDVGQARLQALDPRRGQIDPNRPLER